MTLSEYELRLTAYRLKKLDKERDISLIAWQNWNVQATKTVGQGKSKKEVPLFKTFDDFFNHQKQENQILGIGPVQSSQIDNKSKELLMKANRQKGG